MSFEPVKRLVNERFAQLQKIGPLLVVGIEREVIWDAYLSNFPEASRQEHNCNCCRSFIQQIGNVVAINPDTLHLETLWNIELTEIDEEYRPSILALHAYVQQGQITGKFYYNEGPEAGKDQNFSEKWQTIFRHFNVKIPKPHQGYLAAASGELKATFDVLKRGLEELTVEALDTTLELIAQKSLYRGSEYQHIVQGLKDMEKRYSSVPDRLRNNLVWFLASTQPANICRARNTAIGQLLIDLSEGTKGLDGSVASFEKMVAPTNYKRPTALVTPRMVEAARQELTELGMISALSRRRLDTRDLGPHNALYVHRATPQNKDIFAAITGEPTIKTQELGKVEEIGIQQFLDKVLPTAKNVRVLVENSHLPNFVTLTGAVDPEAPNLFKWESSFGWSYAGGVAASMREKVRAKGGNVDGAFRFTHSWNWDADKPNTSLMDLHVFMPGCKMISGASPQCTGRRVGWNHRTDPASGGVQDVDYTEAAPAGYVPVENITFPQLSKMPEGTYQCKIHNWSLRKPTLSGFQAEIEFAGQIHQYQYDKPLGNKEWVDVAEVELKNGQFTIKHLLPPQNANQTRWGITTNQWRQVKAITLSPNHWEKPTGNLHYMFMLEGCMSDEKTRGFYNEFLNNDLQAHRKVTELLADKVEVIAAEGAELSGLGFSDTEKKSLFVEIESSFKRVVKVLF